MPDAPAPRRHPSPGRSSAPARLAAQGVATSRPGPPAAQDGKPGGGTGLNPSPAGDAEGLRGKGSVKSIFFTEQKGKPHLTSAAELISPSKRGVIKCSPVASFPGNFIHCYFYSKNSLAFSGNHGVFYSCLRNDIPWLERKPGSNSHNLRGRVRSTGRDRGLRPAGRGRAERPGAWAAETGTWVDEVPHPGRRGWGVVRPAGLPLPWDAGSGELEGLCLPPGPRQTGIGGLLVPRGWLLHRQR